MRLSSSDNPIPAMLSTTDNYPSIRHELQQPLSPQVGQKLEYPQTHRT
jgi:hypothetical protein